MCSAGVLRAAGEMEHQSTAVAWTLRVVPSVLPHSTTPQSDAGPRFHHRPLRVRLPSVRAGTLLFTTATPDDDLRTSSHSAGNQCRTGVLLDVQLPH